MIFHTTVLFNCINNKHSFLVSSHTFLLYFLLECISLKLKDSLLIMLQVSVLPPAAMQHYTFKKTRMILPRL